MEGRNSPVLFRHGGVAGSSKLVFSMDLAAAFSVALKRKAEREKRKKEQKNEGDPRGPSGREK